MLQSLRVATATAFFCAINAASAATPPPVEHFARRPQMQGVTLSADGRYVAFLSGSGDDTILMTFDRSQQGSEFKRVTASDPGKFDIGWCRWANTNRLVCGLYGNIRGKKYAEAPFKRIFSVDADGKALKVLEQARNDANLFGGTTSMRNFNINYGPEIERGVQSPYARGGMDEYEGSSVARAYRVEYRPERQDQVVDFTPDDDKTVLIQLDDDRDSYPSLFELNIYTAQRVERLGDNPPIQQFITDGTGNPRIGWGSPDGVSTFYFARLDGEREWRRLGQTQAFNARNPLHPIAMGAGENAAYALGNYEGRDSLWSIDLADKREPKMLFHHALVDVGEPILHSDRRLLGVRYDVEKPYVWYADGKLRELIDRLDRQFPNRVHDVIDSSDDQKVLLIQASSPVDLGTYYIYDVAAEKLQKLGTAYPELDQNALGWMTNITYPAADGTEIPGYLSVATGVARKNLPMVVMPHDGPLARDSWKFDFLRTFLVSRGYAVLQMNYRGSGGLGQKWRLDGQRQWGDLIYSDIQDGTRWAVKEGIADPKRICVMGWGFGGYQALLSAMRDGDLYRCAVSIAGISDLASYQSQGSVTGQEGFRRAMIGTDKEKLRRDSPAQNAVQVSIPVLLIHGNKDFQVQVDQTNDMEKALGGNKKPHEVVIIKGGSHELERKSDRVTLLQAVEAFIGQHIGAGPGT
jgi:dipeptidyl aminopeptidase/acylaminoacyl peptidase